MPEIDAATVSDFVKSKNATAISPLPSVGPDQRGPTCGFYALGFVMQYWYERQYVVGETSYLKAPPPVRTNQAPTAKTPIEQLDKMIDALDGRFSSLRHYGKYNRLTAYGSVFNAESMVKIAQGHGSQYSGQYEGRVVGTASPAGLVQKAKLFLDKQCPLLIPFDVGDDGDPTISSGKDAHWAVIVGYYSESGVDYFMHYHWGAYRYAKALDFAESNHGLTSNELVVFKKIEVKETKTKTDYIEIGTSMGGKKLLQKKVTKTTKVTMRDWVGPGVSNDYSQRAPKSGGKITYTELGPPRENLEFNDPAALHGDTLRTYGAEMWKHGFESNNLVSAGLIRKLVAVYPAIFHAKMMML
jgi:hypothetical protein